MEDPAEQQEDGYPIAAVLMAVTAVLFAPLLVFGVWQTYEVARDTRERVEREVFWSATEVRSVLDRNLAHYTAILKTLAASPAIDSGNFRSLYNQGKAVLEPLELYVLFRDLSGQQLFNTRRAFGEDLPRSLGFDDPLFTTKSPYLSDVVIGDVARRPVVGLSVPVIREGELRYVLTLSIGPEAAARFVDNLNFPEGWTVNIVDRSGTRFIRNPSYAEGIGETLPEGWKPDAFPDLTYTVDHDGEEVIRAVRPSLSGWFVVVSAPQVDLRNQVTSALAKFIGLALILTLLAVAVAYIFGRNTLKTALWLARDARALGNKRPLSTDRSKIREVNLVLSAMRDAAAQSDAHEKQINLLLREVQHRSKNMLAVVLAMARRTTASDIASFRDVFQARVGGLAASLDLLVSNNWAGAQLDALLRSHVEPFGGPAAQRIHMGGPALAVSSRTAQALGMAFHELATNAVKYGALSAASGSVSVHWRIEEGERFVLEWKETGGPVVEPPTEKGFGHAITVRAIEDTLSAEVVLDYRPGGLIWRVSCPLTEIVSEMEDDGAVPGVSGADQAASGSGG